MTSFRPCSPNHGEAPSGMRLSSPWTWTGGCSTQVWLLVGPMFYWLDEALHKGREKIIHLGIGQLEVRGFAGRKVPLPENVPHGLHPTCGVPKHHLQEQPNLAHDSRCIANSMFPAWIYQSGSRIGEKWVSNIE